MFSLAVGLWKWFTQKDEFRILLIGIDNAGKTTTLEQIKRNYKSKTPHIPLERLTPTIGLNLCTVDLDRRTSLIFWDLGGQLMLRGIWENHFKECDGLFFLIDSTDTDRLLEVKSTLESVLEHQSICDRSLPLILMINKQDVSDALPISKVLDILNLSNIMPRTPVIDYNTNNTLCNKKQIFNDIRQHGVPQRPFILAVVGVSALANINIKTAIETLMPMAQSIRSLNKP